MTLFAGRTCVIARAAAVHVLVGAAACAIFAGCASPGLQKSTSQAHSAMAAAELTLQQYGDGNSARPFTRASIDQYTDTLSKTSQRLQAISPPAEKRAEYERTTSAVDDAIDTLRALRADVSRDTARAAAARLRAALAQLPSA
jgi:hypothetical protein